jgi:Cft2 family RNA processing exonuclease
VASPATAALCTRRWKAAEVEVHGFHEPWDEDGARVTLLPAGHILGSSMVLVERAGTRVLYTGDFRLRPAATAEACAPTTADVLVMECTYGQPRHRFPDRRQVVEQLCGFIEECRARGAVPILLAYSLGKAQEVAATLGARGYPLWLHPEAWSLLEVYREFGFDFPGCQCFEETIPAHGVLILPPGPRTRALIQRFPRRRVALLSGWALDPWRSDRFARTGFAISDHADFDELLELVERVQPRKIYTLHGPDTFAARLRERGHDAESAALAVQGSLF